jgi:hypothetical protein
MNNMFFNVAKLSATPVELRESHSTQNITFDFYRFYRTSQFAGTIQDPKTSVSSKKFRLRAGPSKSQFSTKHE